MTRTGMLGSDPDELEALGRAFDDVAANLREQRHRIDRAIEAVTWEGADAATFRSSWSSNGPVAIERAAVLLEGNAEALRRNAQQQRQTSSSEGGAASPPPAPGATMPGATSPTKPDLGYLDPRDIMRTPDVGGGSIPGLRIDGAPTEPDLGYLDPRDIMRTPDVGGGSIPGLRIDADLPRMEDELGPPLENPYTRGGDPPLVELWTTLPVEPIDGPKSIEGIQMAPPPEPIEIGPFPPPGDSPVDPGFEAIDLDGPPLEFINRDTLLGSEPQGSDEP